MKVIVAGAGGFIGGWLTKRLIEDGNTVRAVDVKPFNEWFQRFDGAENLRLDLRENGAKHCNPQYNPIFIF